MDFFLILLLITFVVFVGACIYACIKYRKFGGVVIIAGGLTWLIGYGKKAMAELSKMISNIGFPASLDAVEDTGGTVESYVSQLESASLWMNISYAVLAVGIIWLIIELIVHHRKSTSEQFNAR